MDSPQPARLRIICTHCGREYGVPAKHLGKTARCRCGEEIDLIEPKTRVSCPSCNRAFQVRGRHLGKHVECRCGESFTLAAAALTDRIRVHRIKPGVGHWIAFAVAVPLVPYVIRIYVLQTFFIATPMVPALQVGDRIVALKCSYWFVDPKPNDIVVFRASTPAFYGDPHADPDLAEQKHFIRRVVGTPGDRLKVDTGPDGRRVLHRNGEALTEPYLWSSSDSTDWPEDSSREVVVPADQFVMMSDNRNGSNDSKRWISHTRGAADVNAPFVPRHMLEGKAVLVHWPPDRIRLLH